MNELPSAEFRKVYAKLIEQTAVTVNGHLLGVWTPTPALGTSPLPKEVRSEGVLTRLPGGGIQARQAQRDALLSRINRSK